MLLLCLLALGGIPHVIALTLELLDNEKSMKSVGLFRLSGDSDKIAEYCDDVERGRPLSLLCFLVSLTYCKMKGRGREVLSKELNVDNISGVLKRFFLKQKVPLFPFEVYDDLIEIAAKPDQEAVPLLYSLLHEVSGRPISFQFWLKKLLQSHRVDEPSLAIMRAIFKFFLAVTKYEEINKMGGR